MTEKNTMEVSDYRLVGPTFF